MKQFIGKVIGTKMDKTAKVSVLRIKVHPIYKKRLRVKKTYHVHDEIGVKVNDKVKFQDCRPISKTKKHKIVEIIKDKQVKKEAKKSKK